MAAVSLMVLCFAAFGNALSGEFVWVDHVEIEQGKYLIDSWQDFRDVWTMTLEGYMSRDTGPVVGSGGYYRPLYSLSISLTSYWSSNDTRAFHAENVLWHGLVVLLLYRLGYKLTRSPIVAWVVAAIFAVHPLGVHSVSWISGRKDALCAALAIAAVLVFLRAIEARRKVVRVFLVLLACLLCAGSVLAKELGVVTPIIALLCGWHAISNGAECESQSGEGDRSRPVGLFWFAAAWIWLCIPVAIWLYLRLEWLGGLGLNARYPSDNVLLCIASSARLFWWYVGRILVPGPPQISDAWVISERMSATEWLAIVGLVLVIGLAAWGAWRRYPWGIALALFLVWLIPASGIIPLRHFRAERYLYPGSWALLLAIVSGLHLTVTQRLNLDSKRLAFGEEELTAAHRQRIASTLLCLLLIPLVSWSAWLTIQANRNWSSDQALFADSVIRDPRHAEGHAGLAQSFLTTEDFEESIVAGELAVRLGAETDHLAVYWSPYIVRNNLGLAYYYAGRPAAAIDQFKRVLQQWPSDGLTHFYLGLACLEKGDYAAAKQSFEQRLLQSPYDVEAKSNLALTHLRLMEVKQALQILEQMALDGPLDRTNRLNLASAYLADENYESAYPLLAELFAESNDDLDILTKLSLCLIKLNRFERAQAVLQLAVQVAPQDPRIIQLIKLLRESVE